IGNYRVFNVPTPIGDIANTPEIVAAFEFAVRDGMDVINFSGGGAETEPANDAMIDVIRNVTAAGVVSVISAGNDRDQFGMGSVGSPGSAPEAITVAAVSNTHVIALLSRGHCTFVSKAVRAEAAGAIGVVLVDNRSGGPDAIPIELPLPAGMISDLDGANLRAYLATTGGADVTVGSAIRRVETG